MNPYGSHHRGPLAHCWDLAVGTDPTFTISDPFQFCVVSPAPSCFLLSFKLQLFLWCLRVPFASIINLDGALRGAKSAFTFQPPLL